MTKYERRKSKLRRDEIMREGRESREMFQKKKVNRLTKKETEDMLNFLKRSGQITSKKYQDVLEHQEVLKKE